ncbi:ATP-binding protein [Agathobacter ruminis]|nr:ATP-binding protein [Agathobacter ruminis]MDC7301975.1 ATP-binding protein [Agathobacter ruminis]
MDKIAQEKQDKIIEMVIVVIISLHLLAIMGIALFYEWPSWIPMFLGFAMVMIWFVNLGQFGSANFRVVFTTLFMDAAVIIYSIFEQNMILVLIPLTAVTVTMALYAYTPIIIMSLITIVVTFVIHAFILQTIDFSNPAELFHTQISTINALIICGIVYLWVRLRKMYERYMRQFIQEMERAEKGKDDFLANVSHEIRTPVNTISGLVDSIMQEDNPEKMKEELAKISQAGRSLMFVVTDILDFSELQQGEIYLAEETYNISSTINDLVNMSAGQQNNKKVELIVNYAADLPRGLIGDEKRLRRAIINIVNNAFKFTEEGCVIIDIFWREEAYGINLLISIRDTGIGMKTEELENLFNTYNQADAGRSRNVGGIGLGLAISRAIIQKMGGTISVYSNYEKGTEIRLVVPQKVVDSRPIITIRNAEMVHVGIYFNMEHYEGETRDAYLESILNMKDQLNVKCQFCRNLAELKRRQSENQFTHLFISSVEYREDTEYFDMLSKKMKVIVVLDGEYSREISNQNIYQIYKPFQLMPIAQAINNELENDALTNATKQIVKYICPDVKVLVVDDNELNIQVIMEILKRYQIRVEYALSGTEALKAITSRDFDFVFMDHMMPEMDGVETLHRLRELPGRYYKSVPVVALTANAVAGAREMLLREGFDDFLEKPVEISVLNRLLLRILNPNKIVEVGEEAAVVEKKPKVTPQPVAEETESTGTYSLKNLDREKGYVYCGGEDAFEDILQIYANKGAKNYQPLQDLYEKKDWANYIIAIHGVKSSMKAIGANELSEQARLLEMAGKEDNINYIIENHAKVYRMFYDLIHDLMHHYGIEDPEEKPQQEVAVNLPELSDAQMAILKKNLEDATFELNGDKMLEVIKPARGMAYHGKSLDPVIRQMEQKIKMSDLMSAYDLFSNS